MGGNFKFQVQDSFLDYFFLDIGRFEKRIAPSEKKTPLVIVAKSGVPYIGILDMVVGINFNLQQCDC